MSSVASLTAAPVTSTAMPVVDEARGVGGLESVRNGSASVKQAYASAQGFEEMLLQQLSSSLVQSSGLSGEGESGEGSGEEGSSEAGGEAGGSMLASLLPQTLTDGVMREGGLGLAGQLMGSLDPSSTMAAAAGASAAASGGASVPAPLGSAGGVSAPSAASAPAAGAISHVAAHSGGASA
ncbi:MAG TPA: hypothetical protein VG147_07350 [Solirubrobacteraceae bacterium]|nr:hypothetical protein [Solirubrobacteraceae bacterium]